MSTYGDVLDSVLWLINDHIDKLIPSFIKISLTRKENEKTKVVQ